MDHDPTPMLKEIPFNCDSYHVDGMNLSFLDSESSKPPLHLYHANGFPISVYLPMMIELTGDYRVIGLGLRGQDAQTAGNTSWHQVAEDLIRFLDSKQLGPVLGVGHSVGGVTTMLAAIQRPDLFSRIILIDPVILPYKAIWALFIMRILGKKNRFFQAERARARRNSWTDRYELYEYLKSKSLFKQFDDTYLKSYVTYGFKPSDNGGVELLCPPEAEARIFENYPLDIWHRIPRLKVPVLIIRGENSDVLFEQTVARFCKKVPGASSHLIQGAGHLIPMEKPDELLTILKSFSNS